MTKLLTIILFITLVVSCNTTPDLDAENEKKKADSMDVQFIPVDSFKDTITGKYNSVFQPLMDSLFQYKKIRTLVADSGATIYFIHNKSANEDTTSKYIAIDKNNIRVDIRNFSKDYYYLALSFNYYTRNIRALRICKDTISGSLGDWNLNCW